MNTEILVSTVAYTHMGIELVFSGILTIAMHYGVAANPYLASAVYAGSATGVYQYPVWGGVFVSTLQIDCITI